MTSTSEFDSLVRWLSSPAAYPRNLDAVKHIETHISHVFLAGPIVYKLKKPVQFDFVDFSTMEAREFACLEEVRLNRRLAPDTYLGVVPITRRSDGGFQIDGVGRPIEWLVQMRRLPTDFTLDSLQRRGELRPRHIERLADTLVHFYRSLTPLSVTPREYVDRCQAHVRANQRELLAVRHHLARGITERVHAFQLQLLVCEPQLFAERAVQGRIIDGHGDLRPEHICLNDSVTIFDCIEFSSDLRRIDVADEIAFLWAECDFFGAGWAGDRLWQCYQNRADDRPPAVLIDFYKSYRACVRAKVAVLRALQMHGKERESATAEAGAHLLWADRYAAPWARPLVLVVGGVAGSGKSTLAKSLAEALGAEFLRTDIIRQELFGAGPHHDAIDAGAYSVEARERVYDELFHRAAALNADGVSVVLDGTFSVTRQLEQVRRLARHPRTELLAIECVCPLAVAKERIARRLVEGGDASDARPEIYDFQRTHWQAWPNDIPQIRVATTRPPEEQVQQVVTTLSAASNR